MTKKGVVDWWVSVNIVTGSIAQSRMCRYLSNSEVDFEVFRPAGGHIAPMGVKLSVDCKNCNRK